jgi:hypothetical protein
MSLDLSARALSQCGKCHADFGDAWDFTGGGVECPECGVPQAVAVFPALFRPPEMGERGRDLLVDTHSSCYYHANKEAVRPCEGCGRFLCGLCDIEMKGVHLCPKCIEDNVSKGTYKSQQAVITRYDGIALTLSILPMLLWPFTLITAPVAIFFAIRSFTKPNSVVPRVRWRGTLAIIFATIQVLLWGAFFFGIFGNFFFFTDF